jgi:Flp pilus assembly protein TadG
MRLRPGAIEGTLREQSGQTALEMAFVLPTFFLLLFGLFQLSIALFDYGNATFAAREGVRYASVRSSASPSPCTSATVTAYVTNFLPTVTSSQLTITPTWASGNVIGGTVKVAVKIVYPINIPFFTLTSITMNTTAQRIILN